MTIPFCVWCKPDEVNDATFRYLEVMRRGLREAGFADQGMTQDATLLRRCAVAVSISARSSVGARRLHPSVRLLHWFQGIEAVERRYLHGGWRGWGRYLLWSAMEAYLLRRADMKLFVSEEMRDFLGDRDRDSSRSLVMPCYNVDFDPQAWDQSPRYQRLDLVYAGSLYPWQRVEDSLRAFKAIHRKRNDARLTVFTRELDKARAMCHAEGLQGVEIASVSPEALLQALRRFSYGFILREAMPINEVSTPTKFSSYLAAGVMPILTRATPALTRLANGCPYLIEAVSPEAHEDIAARVLAMASAAPSQTDVRDAYARIFARHFDDAVNARRLAELAREALR